MFDEVYQQELLFKLTDKKYLQRLISLLQPEFFDPQYEPVVVTVLDHFKRTGRALTQGQLRQSCRTHGVKPKTVGTTDVDFDEQELIRFASDRIFAKAMARAQVFRERCQLDRAVEVINECKQRFPRASDSGDVCDALTSHAPIPKRKNLTPCGVERLDVAFDGGIGGGDLAVVLAPTSGGKTSWLVHVAAEAAIRGKKVHFLTLEVPRWDIEGKLRRKLTGSSKPGRNTWTRIAKKLHRKGGRVNIQEASPNSISIVDLSNRLDLDLELLIVDYADYLRLPDKSIGLEYHALGAIYTSLKAVALERKIPVWTASQVNRTAYGSDEIGLQDVSASLMKVMVADQAIGLNQTGETPDTRTGEVTGEINIAKNRHGIRFEVVQVTINWALSSFRQGWTVSN